MTFQPDPEAIVWRLHLRTPPPDVYDVIDSDEGRAAFWAEEAPERDGVIHFRFINAMAYSGALVERDPPGRWAVEYFGSTAAFTLEPDGAGGTDLTLTDRGVPEVDRNEVTAGWLNVLFPLKAYCDFGVDLRSHDPARTWNRGYCDQ